MTPAMTTGSRHIYKNGREFRIRGYNYLNTPIGQGSAYSFAKEKSQLFCDIADMQAMGVNCIRTYYDGYHHDEYGTALLALHNAGISVVMFYYLPHAANYADSTVRDLHLLRFQGMVSTLKRYQAIIGYGIGDENDLIVGTDDIADVYTLVEQMCQNGKAIDPERLYFTTESNVTGFADYMYLVPSVDVWGFNVYRGPTLGTFVQQISELTQKPILLGGWGYSRLDGNGNEREVDQATAVLGLAREIDSLYPTICGHFAFQFSDGWWKAGNNSSHDIDAEEWWGHCEAVAEGNDTPRPKNEVYNQLLAYWSS